jgi:hypothetical protein
MAYVATHSLRVASLKLWLVDYRRRKDSIKYRFHYYRSRFDGTGTNLVANKQMTTSICQVQKRTFTPPSTHCHNRHQNHKLYQPPWETHQQSQNSLEEQSDIKYLGSRYPFGDDELSAVLLFPSPGGAGAKDGCRSSLTGLWNLCACNNRLLVLIYEILKQISKR